MGNYRTRAEALARKRELDGRQFGRRSSKSPLRGRWIHRRYDNSWYIEEGWHTATVWPKRDGSGWQVRVDFMSAQADPDKPNPHRNAVRFGHTNVVASVEEGKRLAESRMQIGMSPPSKSRLKYFERVSIPAAIAVMKKEWPRITGRPPSYKTFVERLKSHHLFWGASPKFIRTAYSAFVRGYKSHSHSPRVLKDVRTLSASQINHELDSLHKKRSKINEEMIAAGRGHETWVETAKKTDPLALKHNAIADRMRDLRWEIERRYGPGAPSRLPRGFGPIKGGY